MDFEVGALAFTVGGGVMFVSGIILAVWRAALQRRARVTEGTVTGLHQGSEGSFPVVTFNAGDAVAGGRVVTFRSNFSRGQDIGEKVPVYYDPRNPQGATLMSPAMTWVFVGMLCGGGILLGGAAGVFGLFLAPAVAKRDRAVEAFIEALREGDDDAVERLSAAKAEIDRDHLDREVPKSRVFEIGQSAMGGGTSCVRGLLEPNHIQITIYLVERGERWKVARAGKKDPECDERLRE